MRMKNNVDFLVPLLLPAAILFLWDISVRFALVPQTLIASPTQVIRDFIELAGNGKLLVHSLSSVYRLLSGFFLGSLLGIIIGVLAGTSKFVERFFAPTMQLISPVPPIAWVPLLIILFGIGEESKIALITIASFTVVYLNTFQGIRSADNRLVEMAKAHRKSRNAVVFRILLPSAMPNILTGLRISMGLSWILLIASELIASSKGLGWFIQDSRNFSRPDDLLVGVITIGLLGAATDKTLAALERKMLAWRETFAGE